MLKWDHELEREAAEAIDKFWLYTAPKWFTWLEWATILGAIELLQSTIHSRELQVIISFSYLALGGYIVAIVESLRPHFMPLLRDTPAPRLTLLMFSLAFFAFTYGAIQAVVNAIKLKI